MIIKRLPPGRTTKHINFRRVRLGFGLGWREYGMSEVCTYWLGPVGFDLWLGPYPDPVLKK